MPVVPLSQRRPPFWRYDLPEARTLFSVFHLSQDNLEHYTRELKRLRPEYIEGYPSVLLILARYLEATGDALPVRAVFTGSEPLLPEHRETIERRFQARAFDYYGLAEGVASAGQCECLNGYHVTMESVVVEVVNARGETVRPGELGEVVGTSLTNLSMPLIRYRTGDIGALRAEGCACGRGLALMNQVVTKCEDIITTPEGRFISPSALTYPFKPIHAIEKSQIVQVARDHIVIRIVRRSGYTEADSARLLAGLRERLGGAIRLDLEFVEDIPRTALGKYRFVISQVPLEVR
jgi:phenylacetate-CoA ligase